MTNVQCLTMNLFSNTTLPLGQKKKKHLETYHRKGVNDTDYL